MKLSQCEFNPPNGAIRWDKLKCLCIDRWTLDGDLIGKILSGSPCLETLELNNCSHFDGGIPVSLFRNFGVLEHLSCDLETYERLISYDDELLGDESEIDDEFFGDESETPISMKLLRCVFNPPNRAIRWDKLKFLCIDGAEFDEYSIGKILARSPCLETFQLNDCCGFTRIDVTSKSIKNLVLSYSGYSAAVYVYTDTIKINAPYILSLTIKGEMYSGELLLENVSSLVKADLNYWVSYPFTKELGRRNYIKEELLRGLLSRLGHVNEIALGASCLQTLSCLEATGFQFRKGSNLRGIWPNDYRVFSLIQK
ncbi:ribonuclease H-like domain-containing protein [Tanacetum coccineum]